jgi:hypothetical protein
MSNLAFINDAALEAFSDRALRAAPVEALHKALDAARDELHSFGYSFIETDLLANVRDLLIQSLERELAEYERDTDHGPDDRAGIRAADKTLAKMEANKEREWQLKQPPTEKSFAEVLEKTFGHKPRET